MHTTPTFITEKLHLVTYYVYTIVLITIIIIINTYRGTYKSAIDTYIVTQTKIKYTS